MSVLTRVAPNELDGTIGTTGSVVLAQDNTRQFLVIQNVHATQNLAATLDGVTTPVINGKGLQLAPGVGFVFDVCVPCGPISVIGSGPNTNFIILYG